MHVQISHRLNAAGDGTEQFMLGSMADEQQGPLCNVSMNTVVILKQPSEESIG